MLVEWNNIFGENHSFFFLFLKELIEQNMRKVRNVFCMSGSTIRS